MYIWVCIHNKCVSVYKTINVVFILMYSYTFTTKLANTRTIFIFLHLNEFKTVLIDLFTIEVIQSCVNYMYIQRIYKPLKILFNILNS